MNIEEGLHEYWRQAREVLDLRRIAALQNVVGCKEVNIYSFFQAFDDLIKIRKQYRTRSIMSNVSTAEKFQVELN